MNRLVAGVLLATWLSQLIKEKPCEAVLAPPLAEGKTGRTNILFP